MRRMVRCFGSVRLAIGLSSAGETALIVDPGGDRSSRGFNTVAMPIARAVPHSVAVHSRGEETGPPPGAIRSHPRDPRFAVLFVGCRSAAAALPAPVLARWFSCSSPRFDTVAMPIARAVPHSVAVHSRGEETGPPPGAIRSHPRDPRLAVLFAGCRSAAAALPAPVLARWFSCSSPRFDTVAMPIARAVPHSVAVHSRGEETGPPPGAIRSHPRDPRLAVLFAGCRSAAAALPAPVLARWIRGRDP